MRTLNAAEVAELKDSLDKLAGRGKHSSPVNFCYMDGYFAKSIEVAYGASITELERFVEVFGRRQAQPVQKVRDDVRPVRYWPVPPPQRLDRPVLCDRRPHHAHPCDRCRRLAAVGVIVNALTDWWDQSDLVQLETVLDALDAVADLLTERAMLVAAHRKELNDTIRDAQRDARDSYCEGKADGRDEAGGGR